MIIYLKFNYIIFQQNISHDKFGFAVENLFLLLVQGLALGDGLFRGEDAVELLAEGAEVLVDKAHHMTIVGSGDVIVACDGCHL